MYSTMCIEFRTWRNIFLLISLSVLVSPEPELPGDKRRPFVCVIGAGYSGLAAARHLQDYGLSFVVFEATKDIGGTWKFDPHVGYDEDGLPVFSSMYRGLRTNTPRETMEYSGFSMPEGTGSFPSGDCFYKYMESFVKHFDLKKYIQFRSLVTSVSWAKDHWSLTYARTDSKTSHRIPCDFVIVSNAQRFSSPNWPEFKGLDNFRGTKIHSHDYKDPKPYVNRRVLVVGAGPSGLDLAVILSRVSAKLVHSHHRNVTTGVPNNYVKKPDIDSFTYNGVRFKDGTFEEIDDVIFCTGYLMSHPFLQKDTGVVAESSFVMPLYQHIVNIVHPSMAFVGLARKAFPKIFDAQAEYAAALAARAFELPSQEDMMKSWLNQMSSTIASGNKIYDVNMINEGLQNYFENLTREAGVARTPPVIVKIRQFNAKNRLEDWLHFREYDFEIIDDKNYRRRHNPGRKDECLVKL